MKKLLLILLCLPILFNSCTFLVPGIAAPKIITNEEVLNKFIGKSKRDIMIEVGTPTKTNKFENDTVVRYSSINQPFGNEDHVRKKKFWCGAFGLLLDFGFAGLLSSMQ